MLCTLMSKGSPWKLPDGFWVIPITFTHLRNSENIHDMRLWEIFANTFDDLVVNRRQSSLRKFWNGFKNATNSPLPWEPEWTVTQHRTTGDICGNFQLLKGFWKTPPVRFERLGRGAVGAEEVDIGINSHLSLGIKQCSTRVTGAQWALKFFLPIQPEFTWAFVGHKVDLCRGLSHLIQI